jgi:hypothetical protein
MLSMSRLDRSGRIPAAAAVEEMGWPAGTRMRVDVRSWRLVLLAAPAGPATVTARAQIAVPVASRRLAGIGDGSMVMLAAFPAGQVLVVHPASEIVRLLRRTHARILGSRYGC